MKSSNIVVGTWITLVLGIVLLVSPWIFAYPANPAMLNAVIFGVLIIGASALTLLTYRTREGFVNFVLLNFMFGAWVFIAPVLFRFNTNDAATWVFNLLGIAVTLIACAQTWQITGTRPSAMVR